MARLGLIALVLVVLAPVLAIWGFQRYGVYQFRTSPERPDPGRHPGVSLATVTGADGTPLHVWIKAPEPGQPVLISFYGNFSGIGPSVERLAPLLTAGWGLASLEYRGSGDAPGRPSEAAFAADARTLYDGLDALIGAPVPADRRVIHGFSLGSGVAVPLAADRPAALLVVESGFARLCDYFENRYHGLPFCRVMWAERYDSVLRIGGARMPVFQAHGAKDTSIPLASAEALFAAAPAATSTFRLYPDAGHSDLPAHGFLQDLQGAYSATRGTAIP